MNKREGTFITHIYAADIVSGLHRLPASFYVSVQIDGKTTKTSQKPVFVDDDGVEWDIEVLLSSEGSSLISFDVYAAFELGPMLGSGELLQQFKITVGDVLDRIQQVQSINFLIQRDGVFPSHPSLRIGAERRIFDINSSRRTSNFVPESNATSELEQQTDAGHLALLRYHKFKNQRDLDECIACFEHVRGMCPPDHPKRSATSFNLATAKFIQWQTTDYPLDLDMSIVLYHNALLHRTINHPDHCTTALHLSFVLLARFQRQGNEEDMREVKDILHRVVERSSAKSYTYRAARLALRVSEITGSDRATDLETYRTETEHVIRLARATLLDLPDGDALRPAILGFLAQQLFQRFKGDGNLAHIHETISTLERAVQVTPDRHPQRPDFWYLLGKSFFFRFQRLHNFADLDKSIPALEEAMRLIPNSEPNKLVWVNDLLNAISCRIEYRGAYADIVKSTWIAEEALRLAPEGHPDKPVWWGNLGDSLFELFKREGQPADINKSISAFERAVNLAPDSHPLKPERLNNLAAIFLYRFEHLGDRADIDKAISTFEEALRLTPRDKPDRPGWIIRLVDSLSQRFQSYDNVADIDKSILMAEEALHLTPVSDPLKPVRSRKLAYLLFRRFERFGNLADLDKSILMAEEAMHLTPNDHVDRPARLNTVGSALLRRFEHRGDIKDVQKSISMFEEAIYLSPVQSPNKSTLLHNLGSALLSSFDERGEFADLKKGISIAEEANQLTPDGDPKKPGRLSNLGSFLLRRFEHTGNLADIDRSILLCEEAVHLTPNGNPRMQAWLNNLGNSLYRRFQTLGNLVDVDKSILLKEQALQLIPNGHPDKPARMDALGSSLLSRFKRTNNPVDLDRSISVKEEAVHITPEGHPERPIWLDNLANSLLARFECTGDLSDIERSIALKEEAMHLISNEHPHKPTILNNLGSCLFHTADINRSLSVRMEAVSLIPDGHPNQPSFLMGIGSTFMESFKHTGDPSDLSAAISHLSTASCAPAGPISDRFFAASGWIEAAKIEGNSQTILQAYTIAIGLLPQLAWLGIPVAERHRVLLAAADLARDAAAAALEAGYAEKAVEWLEEGRSIVWNQLLQLRTPTDELGVEHPTLAAQFQQVSQQLENISSGGGNSQGPSKARSLEEEVKRHHDLALQRENLLRDIRSLPGFERFLLPKSIHQLSALVDSGPVVYLNASRQRCDALIITGKPGHVISVPLTHFSYKNAERLFRLLLKRDYPAVSRDGMPVLISSEFDSDNLALQQFLEMLMGDDREGGVMAGGYTADDRLEWILSFLWENVVNPVLEALGFSTPPSRTEKLTRIFWCPTGPFTFLPIHAAGRYGRSASAGAKLSDFVISSYTPTLGTIAPGTKKDSDSGAPSSKVRLVAVPQPPKDGQTKLKCVKEEIDHIKTLSAKFQLVTLEESHGTVEDVMEKMTHADWVHFACHGVQDPKNPLDSGLCLADERRLKLSDIIRLSRPQGGLAFLSACQTARGDEKLSEESVHLAAGMLLAGYGSVIATMWSIMDRDAPKVARDVYERLFRDGKVPDGTGAAEALHYAVQRLRNSRASFTSWVPFIHVGR